MSLFYCLLGLHSWGWFSLPDTQELEPIHVSQCLRCRKLVGGWRGRVNWAEIASR